MSIGDLMSGTDLGPWFEVVTFAERKDSADSAIPAEGLLQQGDFVPNLRVYYDPEAIQFPATPEVELFALTVIVSQSCDLRPDDTHALVSPVYTVSELQQLGVRLNSDWDRIIRGLNPNYFALAECPEPFARATGAVDLTRTPEVSIRRLEAILEGLGQWLTLRTPHREDLAQHFARKFMRIGYPASHRPASWKLLRDSLSPDAV